MRHLKNKTKRSICKAYHYYQRAQYAAAAPGIREVFFINPISIQYHLPPRTRKKKSFLKCTGTAPQIVSGFNSADCNQKDPRDLLTYASTRERIINGTKWTETPEYQNEIRKLKEGRNLHFTSIAQIDKKYCSLDQVYKQIISDRSFSTAPEHLITINITSEGHYAWGPGGQHRLALALILGVQGLPCKIGLVDSKQIDQIQELRTAKHRLCGLNYVQTNVYADIHPFFSPTCS